MKKRVNITINESVHAKAVQLAKARDVGFSGLVSSLLRQALEMGVEIPLAKEPARECGPTPTDKAAEAENSIASLPNDFRKLTSKPARNGPCPCGSGKKYKRCCEPMFPLVNVQPCQEMSCTVSDSLSESPDDHEAKET